MTYQDLVDKLKELSPEQLQMDVTIYDKSIDDYYPIKKFKIETKDGVLDKTHPVLVIKD